MEPMSSETPHSTTTEWIPLERLEPPETDVRQGRDRDQLRALAQSLDRSGQLQAAKVYPDSYDQYEPEERQQSGTLVDMIDRADYFIVVDGWSRREAARIANWDSLRCEIHAEPPEHQVIASLDANTERLDMSDYETMVSIQSWAEDQGLTQREVAEQLGKSESTISQWFSALDAYEPLQMAWQDPDSHVEYGHVREIERLPTDDLKDRVLQDCLEFDRSVAMTRETAKNTLKGYKRRQQKPDTKEEQEEEGTSKRAAREKARREAEANQDPPCTCCGDRGGHTIALPACKECYGLLTRKKETQEPLIANLDEALEEILEAKDVDLEGEA